jgi:hypothetical protein
VRAHERHDVNQRPRRDACPTRSRRWAGAG